MQIRICKQGGGFANQQIAGKPDELFCITCKHTMNHRMSHNIMCAICNKTYQKKAFGFNKSKITFCDVDINGDRNILSISPNDIAERMRWKCVRCSQMMYVFNSDTEVKCGCCKTMWQVVM